MITEVSKITGISVDDILGRSRRSDIVEARQLYWLLLHDNGFNFAEIGRLSDRKHSAVLMGVRHIKGLLGMDKKLALMHDIMSKTIKR